MTTQLTPAGASGLSFGSFHGPSSGALAAATGAGAAAATGTAAAASVAAATIASATAGFAALGTAAFAASGTAAAPDRDASGRRFIAAERLPVSLSPAERQGWEDGFVQRALWPLLHDLAPLATFELGDWQAFRAVNRKFARAAAGPTGPAGPAPGRRRQSVLAVDTLSPEEGTPEKLHAFAAALELRPALREAVSLLLVVEPGPAAASPAAVALRREIERLVGEINGRLGRAGCIPVRYRFQELGSAERLALYRAADVALVTPLRAGMGLAAKEYCAADLEERGALVLSEFAGAAAQLGGGARLVNPHDVGAAARALTAALRSGGDERRRRMRLLRDEVRAHDVSWWMRELLPELPEMHLA